MTRTARYAARVIAVALLAWAVLPATTAAAAKRCAGKKADIVGTGDRDVLRGTGGSDVITGLAKGDRILGRGGDDSLCGGGGFDRVSGALGNDVLIGSGGGDLLRGGGGDDTLKGGGRDDFLDGGVGNDQLQAGAGDDFLMPLAGDDVVNGGGGSFDIASFESAPGPVTVNLGVTTPQATGEGTDTIAQIEGLVGSPGNDTLLGQNQATGTGNGLFGGDGDDTLEAYDGNDFLGGDGGDDVLDGGSGDDFLDGGPSTTGPPQGDEGHGGSHVNGDECVSLEDAGTNGCESFPARSRWAEMAPA